MTTDKLEAALDDLVGYTCDFLKEMSIAPTIDGLDDNKLLDHWRKNTRLRTAGANWGDLSKKFGKVFIETVIYGCEKPEAEELRSIWEVENAKQNVDDYFLFE